jgi:myo-inositol catabolism protein IolC
VGGDAGVGGVGKQVRLIVESVNEMGSDAQSQSARTTREVWMSKVRELPKLRPGKRFEDAPLIGLETYDPEAVIELLDSFLEQDAEEHRKTLEFLIEALNEGRPEGQKIFPES